MRRRRRITTTPEPLAGLSAFAGFRFPPEVIMLAVRWYLRFGLSYRDLEECEVMSAWSPSSSSEGRVRRRDRRRIPRPHQQATPRTS